mmetsp:Transcript_44856/g.104564  ORF Transcript_44856/g.104564 Transcript_44856/m.104564 type:complete len:240 (-) Transcript_44856:168-887(-)
MTDLFQHGADIGWPVASERNFVERVKRSVGCPITVPNPLPVFQVCCTVCDELHQQVSKCQPAHGHENAQENHGPAKRGQKALTSHHKKAKPLDETKATKHPQSAHRLYNSDQPHDRLILIDRIPHHRHSQEHTRQTGQHHEDVKPVCHVAKETEPIKHQSKQELGSENEHEGVVNHPQRMRPIRPAWHLIQTQGSACRASFNLQFQQEHQRVQEHQRSKQILQHRLQPISYPVHKAGML